MQFLFLRLWYGINLCIAFVWCYNASIKFYTALCNSNSNSNGSRSIMENTWYTFGNVAVVALSTVICSWTHMGKEMMHHSPPHSPNYNLINTFFNFHTIPFTHHCRMCVLYALGCMCLSVCLFICSFVHLLLRFACFQSRRKHITILRDKMSVTGCKSNINSQECKWRCERKKRIRQNVEHLYECLFMKNCMEMLKGLTSIFISIHVH